MNPQALKIVKALALTENGGKIDVKNTKAGKTGEMKSIFQFEPTTWKAYSKQVLGKEVPLTPENESAVTYAKVSEWLDKGHTPDEIASMWNAGPAESDAYTGKFSDGSPSKGINKKYGVQYDVPGYVKKFNDYLGKVGEPPQSGTVPPQTSAPTMPQFTPEVAQNTPPVTAPIIGAGQSTPNIQPGLI